MTDQVTAQAPATEGTGQTPGADAGADSPANAGPTTPTAVVFTPEQEAHIGALLKAEREKERDAARKRQEREQQQAQERTAQEQGQFKHLADQRATQIADLQVENARLTRQLLIAQHGRDLPPALQARVQGDTEDAIKADIAELRKLVTPPSAPRTEAGAGNRPGGGPPKPTNTGEGTFAFQRPGDVPWPQ